MTDLENIARKLEHIGFGVRIEGDKLIIYEGWLEDCLLILGVKTYKEGLAKRAEQLEAEYGLKLIRCTLRTGISCMVFHGEGL